MEVTVDFIVSGVKTRENAAEAHEIIGAYASHFPTYTVHVEHFLVSKEYEELTGVSELDWLLYNATSLEFICHVEFVNMSNIRRCTLAQIIEPIKKFREDNMRFPNSHCGKFKLDIEPNTVQGVTGMYYNVNNRTKPVRAISNTFLGLPKVALLVPMTLRGIKGDAKTKKCPILFDLAPSLKKTFAHCMMDRGIFIGIDEDEVFPDNTLEIIENRFTRSLGIKVESFIKFPKDWRRGKNMSKMYNLLFKHAMMNGYDFAVQLQDDTRLETPGWDKLLGTYLCSNPYAIGAYSLSDRMEPTLLRNVMVSRSHFDIFGYMFNPEADDPELWIKKVLGIYSKVIAKTKVTNTNRKTRRRGNGTDHMYASRGLVDQKIIDADTLFFKNCFIQRFD